jgi:hypothetical protein
VKLHAYSPIRGFVENPGQLPRLVGLMQDRIVQKFSADMLGQGTVYDLDGGDHTLSPLFANSYVRIRHDSACQLVVPTDEAIEARKMAPHELYEWTRGIQAGSGQLTIVAETGVTINYPETLALYKQWSSFVLIKVARNTWDFDGDTELA